MRCEHTARSAHRGCRESRPPQFDRGEGVQHRLERGPSDSEPVGSTGSLLFIETNVWTT